MAFEEPIIGASGVVSAGYTIKNSCRFNSADSAYTAFTPGSASSQREAIVFMWVKQVTINDTGNLFSAANGNNDRIRWSNDGDSALMAQFNDSVSGEKETTQLFRDPSAWMHIIMSIDSAQSDVADRCKLYVNGVEVTSYRTTNGPSLNYAIGFGKNSQHVVGAAAVSVSQYLNGYLAQVGMMVDVSIQNGDFDISDFIGTDTNGNAIPVDVTGLAYASTAHDFLLDFAVAPGTGNGAGTDVSGNANHFTDSGLAANDQVTDSPSDDADNDVGNYMTWNPLDHLAGGTYVHSNGNLTITGSGSIITASTPFPKTGKWYVECTCGSSSPNTEIGVIDASVFPLSTTAIGVQYLSGTGNKLVNTSSSSYGDTYTTGDVIGIALNMDDGEVTFYKNNSTQGDITGLDTTLNYKLGMERHAGTVQWDLNAGQLGFAYTPPTDFKAVHTGNFPAPTITDPSKYFQVDTFTGTGAELDRTLTDASGATIVADMVWIKDRDSYVENVVVDVVRGVTKEWNTDSTNDETTVAQGVKAFSPTYQLGTDSNYNASSSPNVAWVWHTQGGAGSSNTDGSINTTTTSVGTTQGMSISKFTGTGANATVGHGLGAAPDFIMVKKMTTGAGASACMVYHSGFAATDALRMDAGSALDASSGWWNDTAPTSSVFSVGNAERTNESGETLVAYCWAGVEGYSKFGSYEGNGNADGPFVWCGFRPAWILCKSIDSSSDWFLYDSARSPINDVGIWLTPNGTEIENAPSAGFDILSSGFKLRRTYDPNIAETYVFMSFADKPFGGVDVSQARAR